MKNEAAIFLLALQFLTRIPVSIEGIYSPQRLQASVRYYPIIGFLVGVFSALAFWLCTFFLPASVSIAIAILVGLLVTGAFHEDGLADTFDGIGGGLTRARSLDIMKDSRLGTYGTVALIAALGLKFLSLQALPAAMIIGAFFAAHTASRLSSIVVIATSTYAREDGKAKPVATGISAASFIVAAFTGISVLAAAALLIPLQAIASGLAGLVIGHIGMRLFFERKLGGYTGDTLGAVQQASEIGFYLGLLAWL